MTGDQVLRYRSRLFAYSGLDAGDRARIDALLDQRQRNIAPRRDVVSEGEVPRFVHFVLDGWGCRYRQMPDGRRQLLSLLSHTPRSEALKQLHIPPDAGERRLSKLRRKFFADNDAILMWTALFCGYVSKE